MSILSVSQDSAGLTTIRPQIVLIDTDDTDTEITTSGYLNKYINQFGNTFSTKNLYLIRSTDFGNNLYNLTRASTGAYTFSDNINALIQLKSNIKAGTATIVAAGAGPKTIAVPGLVATSVVVANIEISLNPASVISASAGAGSFDITFSADPGAGCTVNWIAFVDSQ